MTKAEIDTLKPFGVEVSTRAAPTLRSRQFKALENFGRVRLSDNFFMRDFLYSEVSAVHGIPNVPDDPELAIEAGKRLFENLLEPLRATFGHLAIRSAFRSAAVNRYCNRHRLGCAGNERNFHRHIWDRERAGGESGPHGGCVGATACVVVPWFIPHYERGTSWQAMAWWIHDHLQYCEMVFFPGYAAFNLHWCENPVRRIKSFVEPKGSLTEPGKANHLGDHSTEYPGFPQLELY
ncbi:MAG: hypothetical protein OXQ29_27675 [Rhodospirillaceae bacterium]|nr:hypothetical protein [Rhodospirillaceae bacterium]